MNVFPIENMHYDFKMKLNKGDSQKWRNLKIQEIDWKLNEALQLYVKTIAEPRFRDTLGLEINQRIIDDLRPILKEGVEVNTTSFDSTTYNITLPDDYWYMASTSAIGSKNPCIGVKLKCNEREHNDQFEDSPFDNSNFEWRETNFVYHSGGMRFFTDGTFSVDKAIIDYLLEPSYIHFAEGLGSDGYQLPDGTQLTGKQSAPFSSTVCREIVDIAVAITAGDLQMSDLQVKLMKMRLND